MSKIITKEAEKKPEQINVYINVVDEEKVSEGQKTALNRLRRIFAEHLKNESTDLHEGIKP